MNNPGSLTFFQLFNLATIIDIVMHEKYIVDPEFWDSLVNSNALSRKLADQFKYTQEKSPWMPLGAILVNKGFLKLKEVTGLLAIQEQEPRERIGDLAVREGYCTTQQIKKALEIQRKSSPGAIDLILRDVPTGDRLTKALVAYIHFLEGKIQSAEPPGV